MSKIKKIIGVFVITMFLSALSINFGLIQVANANPLCPGWDGYSAFCGITDDPQNPCQIVAQCTMVCIGGC